MKKAAIWYINLIVICLLGWTPIFFFANNPKEAALGASIESYGKAMAQSGVEYSSFLNEFTKNIDTNISIKKSLMETGLFSSIEPIAMESIIGSARYAKSFEAQEPFRVTLHAKAKSGNDLHIHLVVLKKKYLPMKFTKVISFSRIDVVNTTVKSNKSILSSYSDDDFYQIFIRDTNIRTSAIKRMISID